MNLLNKLLLVIFTGGILTLLSACNFNQNNHSFELTHDQPAEKQYPSSERPDRVNLTWSDDPKTTQSVSWRTIDNVNQSYGQIVKDIGRSPIQEGDELDFSLADELDTIYKAESVQAETSKIDWPGANDHYHSVTFRDLKPGTSYLYRVGNGEHWSEWHRFRTESEANESFSFIYLGDAQNNTFEYWPAAVRASYSHFPKAKFAIHAGDLALSSGGDHIWGNWFEAGGWIHATRPNLPSPGNSDHIRLATEEVDQRMVYPQWRAQFTLPQNGPDALRDYTYYMDYQNARFISLYSNFQSVRDGREILLDPDTKVTDEIMEEQTEWLKDVLEKSEQDWNIVVFHHPVFTAREDRHNERLSAQWRDVFTEMGVDLVLQGHDHAYSRGRDPELRANLDDSRTGPIYTISNAGGKSRPLDRTGEALDWADIAAENVQLYQHIEIDGNTLIYSSYIMNGELFDRFRLVQDDNDHNLFEELKPGHSFEYQW